MHESSSPIFTGFVDVFFNCMLPIIIPANDETNGNKIIIAATQINFQPFSTIPNHPLCERTGITGNITLIMPKINTNWCFFFTLFSFVNFRFFVLCDFPINWNWDFIYSKGFNNCYILLSNISQSLENTKFIAGELSLIVSLALYRPTSVYELW